MTEIAVPSISLKEDSLKYGEDANPHSSDETLCSPKKEDLGESSDIQVEIEHLGDDSTCNSDADDAQLRALKRRSVSRVTFRSRVRITSGFNHHRRSSYSRRTQSCSIPGFTPDSSRSCSPSSSISAPLRFHSEESEARPGWGTLGQRVALFAQRSAQKRQLRAQSKQQARARRAYSEPCYAEIQANENTPLLAAGGMYGAGGYTCQCERCQKDDDTATFWSTGLLDYQRWWHSVYRLMTCGCFDDSDEE
ncbi:hypothetical protein CC2G_000908 [Coprinopsis cinerea AmutBmut pab1-1]|nr:hypothetical protein CC2G_000908 [Coprinopsis cinerea AmutBmut pab1-1]